MAQISIYGIDIQSAPPPTTAYNESQSDTIPVPIDPADPEVTVWTIPPQTLSLTSSSPQIVDLGEILELLFLDQSSYQKYDEATQSYIIKPHHDYLQFDIKIPELQWLIDLKFTISFLNPDGDVKCGASINNTGIQADQTFKKSSSPQSASWIIPAKLLKVGTNTLNISSSNHSHGNIQVISASLQSSFSSKMKLNYYFKAVHAENIPANSDKRTVNLTKKSGVISTEEQIFSFSESIGFCTKVNASILVLSLSTSVNGSITMDQTFKNSVVISSEKTSQTTYEFDICKKDTTIHWWSLVVQYVILGSFHLDVSMDEQVGLLIETFPVSAVQLLSKK